MTPSSEEIAAALEVAARLMDERAGHLGGVERQVSAAAGYKAQASTLRSHLSRLREEATFREAALHIGAYLDELYAPAALEPQMLRLLKAYRALEEPRDAT